MTKREIIYTVIEKIKANSDDSKITEEFISSMIDTKRAFLLKQQYSKSSWNIPIELKQEVCLSIEVVNTIDGFCEAGKTIRTSESLLNPIKIKGRVGPLMIRREDGFAIPINMIPVERMPYVGSNSFIANLTYAAIDMDNKLILFSKDDKLKFIKKIRVTDIYESPDEAYLSMCSVSDENIEPWDRDYPVELAMIDPIVDLIMKDLLNVITIPEDKSNDADDRRR
jgi:hypothetical protein